MPIARVLGGCILYLRAKEKWAEALGEKFLGLSCGLVPGGKKWHFSKQLSHKKSHLDRGGLHLSPPAEVHEFEAISK